MLDGIFGTHSAHERLAWTAVGGNDHLFPLHLGDHETVIVIWVDPVNVEFGAEIIVSSANFLQTNYYVDRFFEILDSSIDFLKTEFRIRNLYLTI